MQAKELKIYKGSGRNYTPIPQIIIQGKWLRPLGFFVGDKVTVTQEGNRLIIEKSEEDLRGLHVDRKDSDQLFLLKELRSIMRKLAEAGCGIEYLSRPVKEVGFLHREEGGEYATG